MVEGLWLWTDEGSAEIMEEKIIKKIIFCLLFIVFHCFHVSPLWVEATGL